MWINNIRIFPSRDVSSLEILDGVITQCSPDKVGGDGIDGREGILTPGLINSHEHLDFDLYEMLGTPPYKDYREWAMGLHAGYKTEINEIEKIPRRLREMWGVVRNLLNGVTTVINHGARLDCTCFPITVIDHFQDLHSVGFEKNWKLKLNDVRRLGMPCVIHAGEGIGERSHAEITDLIRANVFARKIIGVHGVAMDASQAEHFEALVWCPATNDFMLHTQPDIQILKTKTTILFGTDSTLTSAWNIREHLRFARSRGLLNDEELFESCTSAPADIWELNAGRIRPGEEASLVISKGTGHLNNMESFYDIDPSNIDLVMHKGNIVLSHADVQAAHLMKSINSFEYAGRRYFSVIDIRSLINEILIWRPGFSFSPGFIDQQQAV
jgi:cytosine/adenosine deaminase-related metal-dependent hydrolase